MLRRSLLLASAAFLPVMGEDREEPCAAIADLKAKGGDFLPAGLAFDCLNSVPVDKKGDEELIEDLKVAWQWYSDITWLKKPPPTWENGPLDIIAELDNIKGHLDKFENEYLVQLAIRKITVRTGDFHFNYAPDILSVFGWQRDFSIVSLSEDGKKLPKVYITADALANVGQNGTGSGAEISEITKLNGEDVYSYLETLADWEQYRDTDGRLNSLWATGDTLSQGAFMVQSRFDGDVTNVTFANGTTQTFQNSAWTAQDFRGVKDGKSFFDKFCKGDIFGYKAGDNADFIYAPTWGKHPAPVTPNKNHYHSHTKREIVPERFPEPVFQAKSKAVAGYFLNGEGYDDIAVLKITNFDPVDDEAGVEFQSVISKFLNGCAVEKKSQLIIDLRENGGGQIQLLIDTFMQLFPHRVLWQGHQYRTTPHFKLIGDAVSEIHNDEKMNRYYKDTYNATIDDHYRYWAYSQFTDAQGKNFDKWEQYKGPEIFHEDQYTAVSRYNYSNANEISVRWGGFNFTDPTNQNTPFNHTNIVMFTDALCGSACAHIHEELKNNVGIRSVTVGGRALNGPIQAVTGTRGGEVVPLMYGLEDAEHMRNMSRKFNLKSYPSNEKTLDELIDTEQLQRRAGNENTRIQMQLKLRKGDKTATPLQYIYEAADCRIFYTHETFANPEKAWKQVWDAYKDDSKCVEGSTKDKSSISGGFQPYGPYSLKSEDVPKGAGSEKSNEEKSKEEKQKLTESGKPEDNKDGAGSKISFSAAAAFAALVVAAMQL